MKADPTLPWFKSTFSQGSSGCVETAPLPDGGMVAVRDSKDPAGPMLRFTGDKWRKFIAGVKEGRHGL